MAEFDKAPRVLGGIKVAGSRVSAIDRAFMRRALDLARRAAGRSHPNPMVGCVIVKDGRIIGEGYHRGAGQPHAEVEAVADAGGPANVTGATVYINLEPCVHYGRTPPCIDLLLQCRPAEVVVAHEDPDPRVAGKGLARLKAAGIPVITGVEREAALALNEAWLTWVKTERPFVALKFAMSLDGKVAARGGHSKWITNESARQKAHQLRDQYDAVLVGVGTVLADDPQLTCRIPSGRDPIRIVLDTNARTPATAKILSLNSPAPTWICTADEIDEERLQKFDRPGVEVIRLPRRKGGGLDLAHLGQVLAQREIVSILVEGGPRVHRSFLDCGLVDKLYVFVGARTVGGDDAPGPIAGPAVDHMSLAGDWEIRHVEMLAGDILCQAYPARTIFTADGLNGGRG